MHPARGRRRCCERHPRPHRGPPRMSARGRKAQRESGITPWGQPQCFAAALRWSIECARHSGNAPPVTRSAKDPFAQ